jgi:hypothetical protein
MILAGRILGGPMPDSPVTLRRVRDHSCIVRRLTVLQFPDRPTGHVLRIAS